MRRNCAATFDWLPKLDSTRNLLRLVVVFLQLLHLCSSMQTGVIGILTELTNPTECEIIVPTIVYETEALKWMLNKLNADNYTGGVKLEIDIVDTCEPKSSVMRTMELINKYKTGPKKLIGILSMTTSANMLNVSWFLSSLPEKERLIQIGTTETANKLNDRTLYPTFFRVIPDDEFQFQLIAELMELLKWNYIAILHEKDVYGEEGAEILSSKMADHHITLAAKLGIDDFNEQMFTIITEYQGVQAVVIIAQSWTLKNVDEGRVKGFQFIFSESLTVETLSNTDLFENALAILQQKIAFPPIEQHWAKLFELDDLNENPNFSITLHQHTVCCNLTESAKKLSKIIHKMSVLPKLVGFYTFAFLVRENIASCVKLPCQLSAVKLDDIHKKTIDLSYLGQILSLPSINNTASFNAKGSLVYPKDFQAYQVYKNVQDENSGSSTFEKVGEYNGKRLVLNETAVKDLELRGVCRPGHNCKKDIPTFIYKEGDIMLFGIVPVRTSDDARSCRSHDLTSKFKGSQLAEAMFYAVDTLNQKKLYKDLFPNKKLGIIVMDSCNQQIPTFKALLSFLNGSARICRKIRNCTELIAKTFVYIGGLTSEVSIRILQLMDALNTVQISYASTSSVFRGPLILEYPHFLRLTPSDSQQISVIIDICVHMKWRYVSLIYADNAYGRSAQRELISKAKDAEVCVTQSLSFAKDDDPDYLLTNLKRRPDAKVVIVFLNSAMLRNVMSYLGTHMKEREFTFLGSEAWGRYLRLDSLAEKFHGSLTLGIDIHPDREFENYRKRTELNLDKNNPWTVAAMESKCYMPGSLNQESGKACPPNLTLNYVGEQNQWASMVIQSVYAAAVGLNMSISQLCDKLEVCPRLFQKFSEVIRIFKKVELKDPDGQYRRVFDADGDGARSYIVYMIQGMNRKFDYIEIGHWSKKSGLVLDDKQINQKAVRCPNQKRCSECPSVQVQIERNSSENYIPPLIGFIFLLLILIIIILGFWKCSKLKVEHNDLSRTGGTNNESYIADPNDNNGTHHYSEIVSTTPKSVWTGGAISQNPAYEGFQPRHNIMHTDAQNNFNYSATMPPKRDSTKYLNVAMQCEGAQADTFGPEETQPKQLAYEDDSETHLKLPVEFSHIYPVSDDDEQSQM